MSLPGLTRYTDQGATFDEPERRYRYRLWRYWSDGPIALWIMLNPSTADEHVLDPTLRRVEGFTRSWGYGGFGVVNAFALRATDPDDLVEAHEAHQFEARQGRENNPDTPCAVGGRLGAENDWAIQQAAANASLIVVGWGKEKITQERGKTIAFMLRRWKLHCLGVNKDGSPKHPLYLAAETPLQIFREATE